MFSERVVYLNTLIDIVSVFAAMAVNISVCVCVRERDVCCNRYSFWFQGEVEQIAMMKPKALTEHEEGMLEFLEDIIGSNRFKQPIEILNKRVDNLNELRSEKVMIFFLRNLITKTVLS